MNGKLTMHSQQMQPNAATVNDVPDAFIKIRTAFDVFESQSTLLQASYEGLKKGLAASNERLQCILESLTDGVLVVADNLVVERCNPASESLLNRYRADIEGRPYDKIINGLGNVNALRAALQDGKASLDEPRSRVNGDGDTIDVLASVAPIRSHEGTILGAIEVLRNVTELRRLEEKVNCQKRMAALGEMAASVAHEIRNPLGTIEGFARLLKRDLENAPQYSRLAGKIVEGAQNLNYVIANLLTYARPMSLQYERFNVQTLLTKVHELLVNRASGANVKLAVHAADHQLCINGDIQQLRLVLVNLGLNAIEASCRNGEACVSLSARSDRNKVLLAVADNGCGLSDADKLRIFDPFFTRKEGGTGLGLSLCHKIVTAHNGVITVSSKPGTGSVFEVVLPCGTRSKQMNKSELRVPSSELKEGHDAH